MRTNHKKRKTGPPHKGIYRRGLNTALETTFFQYEGIYAIYALSSSDDPENIKYVGFTSMPLNKRYNNHISCSKNNHTPKEQWINGILEKDQELVLTILEDGILARSEAFAKEKHYIKRFRDTEEEVAALTNVTDGGIGTTGMVHSEETRLRQRQANLGRQFRLGQIVTEATREKLRAAARNRKERAQEAKQNKNN